MFSPKCLKEIRLKNKLTQTELAKELGITRMSFSAWETGKTVPNKANLSLLAKLLNVDETAFESEYKIINTYLKLNVNYRSTLEDYADKLLEQQIVEENKVVQLYAVQVLNDIRLSAGPGQGFANEYETRTVYTSKEYSGYDIATWIEGTSMSPKYLDGEVALIRETGFDYDGAVYALIWDGRTYIKKLYREEEGIRMVSINKRGNPDRFISYEDDFRIVGKVVGHFMPVEEV